jgi:hypothetical protein
MIFSPDSIRQVLNSQSFSAGLASASSNNQRPSPPPAISHQSSSADLLPASSSSYQQPSPLPTAIHVNDASIEDQKQPSSFLFLPITQETSNVTTGRTTPLSGRDTPTISNWQQAEVKPVAKG